MRRPGSSSSRDPPTMPHAWRAANGDLLKNMLNLVAARLGIGNDVKGQSRLSDVRQRMLESIH
jgi:hypothetical protein